MKRERPYSYKGWRVYHYIVGPEEFIACRDWHVLRAATKAAIEEKIDKETP